MSCSLEEIERLHNKLQSCLLKNLFVCVSRGGASSDTVEIYKIG